MSKDKAKERAFYALDMAIRADNDGEAVAKFEIARKMMANSSITLHDVHPKVKIESDTDGVANDLRETILSMEDEAVSLRHTLLTKDETIRMLQGNLTMLYADIKHLRGLLTRAAPRVSCDPDLLEDILDAMMEPTDLLVGVESPEASESAVEAQDEPQVAEIEEEPSVAVLAPAEAILGSMVRYRPSGDPARQLAIACAEGCSFATLKAIFVQSTGSAKGWMVRLSEKTGYGRATINGWSRTGFVPAIAMRILARTLGPAVSVHKSAKYHDRRRATRCLYGLIDEVIGNGPSDALREMVFDRYGELLSLEAIEFAANKMREQAV